MTTIVSTPASTAASTTAKISSRDEMPGGEHEVVPRDDAQHLQQLRQRRAAVVEHRHRLRRRARRAQLELEAHPHGHVAVAVGALDLGELVLAR